MERRIATVSQINAYIKNAIDSDILLQNIWVKGEISNFKLHYSGHMYLSLKDSDCVLRAVMFRGASSTLRFMPENGMQVLARGRISVYPRDGSYQLYIEEMEPEGVGALYIAFEQLKEKLSKEGLFDETRKKPIPRFPACVGVVTSATGAALQDILHILKRRSKLTNVSIYPVLVQGVGAASEIAHAIRYFNIKKEADVLIVGRGGGSQEDLWAFNEETVARAVANSEIPVISAVGHETDFTICDFAADLRAPTPSAAAELAVPSEEDIRVYLSALEKRITASLALIVSKRRERLTEYTHRLANTTKRMDELRYALDMMTNRAETAIHQKLQIAGDTLIKNVSTLDALSPLKVLRRGYAVVSKEGKTVHTVGVLKPKDDLQIRFADGKVSCVVTKTEGGKNDDI